jgi:hypothetical protein
MVGHRRDSRPAHPMVASATARVAITLHLDHNLRRRSDRPPTRYHAPGEQARLGPRRLSINQPKHQQATEAKGLQPKPWRLESRRGDLAL